MLNWREFPFFRWLIPLSLGIITAHFYPIDSLFPNILFLIFLVIGISLNTIRGSFHGPKFAMLLFFISFFLLGFQRTIYNNDLKDPVHFRHQLSTDNYLTGMVSEMPVRKNKRLKIVLETKSISPNLDSLQNCRGKILTYIPIDEESKKLKYGDLILGNLKLQEIPETKNPHSFDYKRYLHFQNIHYQAFLKEDSWVSINKNEGYSIMKVALNLRSHFIEILRKHLPNENEFSVGSALILGYKDELKEEVREAYTHTGAMHVLAVSGLHVGLIFLIINTLLKVVRNTRMWWKILKTILLISTIWSYAVLTGASPSVLRASTMFSFLIIGLAFDRPNNIYNSLAASAVLLLLYDPNLIMNIGFQLSYLAVIGIVFFQPVFAKMWFIKNRVGNYLWQLACVSFAAQLTTLPISLFYFHQFPFYFWLSGLVVVPAAAFILCGGIMLFILELSSPFSSEGLGHALNILISGVNWCIFTISKIPGSLLSGIWISAVSVGLLYFSIGSIARAINTEKAKWVFISLAFVFIASINFSFSAFENTYNKQVIVYDIYKNSIIDLVDGQQVYSLQSDSLEASSIKFITENNRWAMGAQKIKILHFSDTSSIHFKHLFFQNDHFSEHNLNFLQFYELRIGIISNKIRLKDLNQKLKVDFLIIRNNPYLNIAEVQSIFEFDKIIFDSSNAKWKCKKWEEECLDLGIDYWNIAEKGAFIVDYQGK